MSHAPHGGGAIGALVYRELMYLACIWNVYAPLYRLGATMRARQPDMVRFGGFGQICSGAVTRQPDISPSLTHASAQVGESQNCDLALLGTDEVLVDKVADYLVHALARGAHQRGEVGLRQLHLDAHPFGRPHAV